MGYGFLMMKFNISAYSRSGILQLSLNEFFCLTNKRLEAAYNLGAKFPESILVGKKLNLSELP